VNDSSVLVLTDDELTCIAATNARPWALPLGPVRDPAVVVASALAGERSLIARGLLGRNQSGTFVLGDEAFPYLRPCLETEPDRVAFVVDDGFRWALQGMSVAFYGEDDTGVLEVRAANGLHHFLLPTQDGLNRGLMNYVTAAYGAGFPDAIPGASLSLCVVSKQAGMAFRVTQGNVQEGRAASAPLPSAEWRPSTLERALEAVTSK
jgi:hypothetical protein